MNLIPFEPHHARLIRPQEAQSWEVAAGSMREQPGTCWTVVHEGLPVCIGGFIQTGESDAYAWALLDIDACRVMVSLTRAIRATLQASGFSRIDMAVETGFAAGCRWAELLGFSRAELRPGLLEGRDAWIYRWHTRSPTS